MEQMQIDPEMRIEIDYQDWPLTSATQKLQPILFKDGEAFYCLLGPDPQKGIFGRGDSAYEAVIDWEQHLHDRLAENIGADQVTGYVKRSLNIQDIF
jgi:hypothetical protein